MMVRKQIERANVHYIFDKHVLLDLSLVRFQSITLLEIFSSGVNFLKSCLLNFDATFFEILVKRFNYPSQFWLQLHDKFQNQS